MKIIGLLLIVCSCTGAGLYAVRSLKRNADRWRAWTIFLCRLHEQLRYTALPVQQLLCDLSYEPELSELKWLTAFREESATLSCPNKDVDEAERDFFMSFFSPLGKTDLDGQLSHINVCLSRAREEERKALEKWHSHARLYMTGGVCAGLCAALLLA